MLPHSQKHKEGLFNEQEWLRVLFALGDIQTWLSEMEQDLFLKQPSGKKKLFRKTYYLTASSFAHIVERHYYKIPRHIGAAKFTVAIPEILDWLRVAFQQTPVPLPGSLNFVREFNTGAEIGFDKAGTTTTILTVITDTGGKILTAFPGAYSQRSLRGERTTDDPSSNGFFTQLEEEETVYYRCSVHVHHKKTVISL